MSRLVLVQSDRWSKRIDGGNGGPIYPYSTEHCAYCMRPVRPDATFLYTARTNDGEWWLVSADEDLKTAEWRDFQTQADGSRTPTLLPIGPDCLRNHPEFAFAVANKLGIAVEQLGGVLYDRMQQPGFEDALKRAFAASPAEIGRAAVKAARERP